MTRCFILITSVRRSVIHNQNIEGCVRLNNELNNKSAKGCCRGVGCDMGWCLGVRGVLRELVLLTVENDRHEIYS